MRPPEEEQMRELQSRVVVLEKLCSYLSATLIGAKTWDGETWREVMDHRRRDALKKLTEELEETTKAMV